MTAKEKAEKLVDRMSGFDYEDSIADALVCVDEILNINIKTTTEECMKLIKYWNEVKIEIEKLRPTY